MSLSRLTAALLIAASSATFAFAAGPTDPQIAHIAYTAGVIDIEAAKLALQKSKNAEVVAFANDMVRDHEAVNEQALALVKKLGVTPEDNDTSKGLAAAAEEKRAEPRGARRRRLRQGLCRERGRLPPDRQRRARNDAHPERIERRAEGASEDRAQDLPGPPAARRASRSRR